ncbi:MAG: glycosyltransferase family A protein [Planctomycetota bacterium]
MSTNVLIDVLMVTYNRPAYTAAALGRLLDTADAQTRVWVWHNCNDADPANAETLDIVRRHEARLHHLTVSEENKRLREPTNWFWQTSDAPLMAKVDDDNLMPTGWAEALRESHRLEPKLGAIACWGFLESDWVPGLADGKIRELGGGHELMVNCWVSGTGHVLKREMVEQCGPIGEGMSFPAWCIAAAKRGWVNGYHVPLLIAENLDDPRHPDTLIRTEADFQERRGLSARQHGVRTRADLIARQSVLARNLQEAPADPAKLTSVATRGKAKIRRLFRKLTRAA